MADLKHFSDESFKVDVLEAAGPVLVDFTAVWCPPCKLLEPIVQQIASEYNGSLQVGELDIDENVETTMQYGVMGVPTLVLFKNGQAVERLVGYMPKDRIVAKLSPHLA
jgi:thioredoxin 1